MNIGELKCSDVNIEKITAKSLIYGWRIEARK